MSGGGAAPDDAVRDAGRGAHGCAHYRRRAKLVAPCCGGEAFWCRHCHNEARCVREPDWSRKHELDRSTVTEVVCALCDARQPKAEHCSSCGVSFGVYACTACPFYDDEGVAKQTYHCDSCRLCRVGGRDNFFHCPKCNACYAVALRNNHACVENSMRSSCPVCYEHLFESVDPTTVLRCGHTIHSECLAGLEAAAAAAGTCAVCAVCKRSLADYSARWDALDAAVAATPVPPEHAGWEADALCNDCGAGSTAAFHLLGLRCGACGSYNTRRLALRAAAAGAGGGGGGGGGGEQGEQGGGEGEEGGPDLGGLGLGAPGGGGGDSGSSSDGEWGGAPD